ncbi:TRAP transporter small permease [Fulvimarina sp. MAC3]|uniref:TRAP transporter small permease n=1 Tax=Fulvimarina sp. MAC3 TaxID=3148887 RepID=UPI0031FC3882
MLDRLDRWAAGLTSLAALIGTLGLITEVVVILADVIGRYFGAPISGAQDVSTMAMVILVFGGMALCDRTGGHIAVDLFEGVMPHWMRHAGDVVSALLGAVIFIGIAWTMWESAQLSRMLNLATNIIQLPKFWFQYAVIAFSLIAAFGMGLRAVTLMFGARRGRRVEDVI